MTKRLFYIHRVLQSTIHPCRNSHPSSNIELGGEGNPEIFLTKDEVKILKLEIKAMIAQI